MDCRVRPGNDERRLGVRRLIDWHCISRAMDYVTRVANIPDPVPVSPYVAGVLGRCPRCGKGKLFQGFLSLRPRCEVCGLDFNFIDAGDGPAIFVILFAGFVVVGAALLVEVAYQPPFWVHAVLWGPLILLTTLGPLRPIKGLLIALQYHHRAAEGRLEQTRREP
jgi:uncharacterized protein (DUF983 family)